MMKTYEVIYNCKEFFQSFFLHLYFHEVVNLFPSFTFINLVKEGYVDPPD